MSEAAATPTTSTATSAPAASNSPATPDSSPSTNTGSDAQPGSQSAPVDDIPWDREITLPVGKEEKRLKLQELRDRAVQFDHLKRDRDARARELAEYRKREQAEQQAWQRAAQDPVALAQLLHQRGIADPVGTANQMLEARRKWEAMTPEQRAMEERLQRAEQIEAQQRAQQAEEQRRQHEAKEKQRQERYENELGKAAQRAGLSEETPKYRDAVLAYADDIIEGWRKSGESRYRSFDEAVRLAIQEKEAEDQEAFKRLDKARRKALLTADPELAAELEREIRSKFDQSRTQPEARPRDPQTGQFQPANQTGPKVFRTGDSDSFKKLLG